MFRFYIDAFFELDSCRPRETLSPIPFTAIAEFAKMFKVWNFEEFLYLIRRLDNAYMKLTDSKKESVKEDAKEH